ncbi:MAG TPA: hypothetical protein VGA56_07265, partial [Opitutaceae bacterium]
LVLFSESFFSDVQRTFDRVTDFLGLAPHRLKRPEPRRTGGYSGKAIPMENVLRARYRPHNDRLRTLLNKDLPW